METIKARVHDTTIDKVAQFFDAGSTTVMQELFQNARRSGATQVEITELDESTITIRDNGHGIKDPQCVLDFGRSEWNALDHEKPAGMGLFALARLPDHHPVPARGRADDLVRRDRPRALRGESERRCHPQPAQPRST